MAHSLVCCKSMWTGSYLSLKYVGIDPGLSPAEMIAITQEVTERNLPLLGPDEDYWRRSASRAGTFPAATSSRAAAPR
ncbi:MAG: hypothetical protein R2911_19935 [Caldilineaceae bacterium]